MNYAIKITEMGKAYLLHHRDQQTLTLAKFIKQQVSRFFTRSNKSDECFWALKDINLTIQQGERIGLIGDNGAGKSTLLKIISRLTEPSLGEVRVKGRLTSLLEVNTGFHPDLTGRENIFLKGVIHGMSRKAMRQRFDEIVAFAGVEKFLDTQVKYFSSGMYVRLAFAISAFLEPDILIVDEVLAVGDKAFQQSCMDKLIHASKQDRTIIFVSHNMQTVRQICDRVIVMQAGRIAFDGPSQAAIEFYQSKVVNKSKQAEDSQEHYANELYKINSVRLCTSQKTLAASFASNQEISVHIAYEILSANTKMGLSLQVKNRNGLILFTTASNLEPLWQGQARPKGTFTSICVLPANLLIEDSYTIDLTLWEPNFNNNLSMPNAANFVVYDPGTLSKDYPETLPGVIQPAINWTCQKLNAWEL